MEQQEAGLHDTALVFTGFEETDCRIGKQGRGAGRLAMGFDCLLAKMPPACILGAKRSRAAGKLLRLH